MTHDALSMVSASIEAHVLLLRGQRVLLSSQLASLYQIEAKVLNQAVRRNLARFPADFMFQLDREDVKALRSQSVTLNVQDVDLKQFVDLQEGTSKRGEHSKYAPFAFTEQGVAMLSSVLKSDRAISVNIEIMRTFVKLRGMMAEHSELKQQLNALEKKYDQNFKVVFDAINQLMTPPEPAKKKRIGFIQE